MDDTARTGELRRKLEKDPGSRLFAQLAEELRKDGKHDEAISVARKGLEKNPNYPSARMTLARALLDSGRPREARPELEQIVKASPDNIMASRLLGDALHELGETTQALQQFEKTLRISPGDKAVIEKIAELKAALAVPSSPEPPAPVAVSPLPTVDASPSAAVVPLPSVFPAAPATPPVVAAAAPVALDRDLASGTFSPGTLTASDLQRHFEETAARSAGEVTSASQDVDATVGFGEMERSSSATETADTISLFAPPTASEAAPAAPPALPSVEMPAGQPDPGAQTLPLTSVTLADLYLQQGLKAEASAVLSQVLKEEPENAQAKSKFAAVSSDIAQTELVPPKAPPAVARVEAATPARAPRTQARVREHTILSLRAFASAAEREAVHQKATERGAF